MMSTTMQIKPPLVCDEISYNFFKKLVSMLGALLQPSSTRLELRQIPEAWKAELWFFAFLRVVVESDRRVPGNYRPI